MTDDLVVKAKCEACQAAGIVALAIAPEYVLQLLSKIERLQNALNEVMEFNPLRNDRDAYLLAICEWGLKGKWGVDEEFTERPQRGIFGLE